MQTELPTMLNMFETDHFQLEYSESFMGSLHQETAIEGYTYVLYFITNSISIINV